MKLTVNKTNVLPASADYPFGGQKDDDGTLNGTPLDAEFSGDYVQFFEKIFSNSGLTANGLPDNATNGFQLVEAMDAFVEKRFELNYYNDDSAFITNNLVNISSFFYTFNIFNRGTSEFDFANNDTTINIVSFGRSLSPVGTIHNIVFDQNPNGSFAFNIVLNSSNVGTNPQIKLSGNTTPNSNFSITVGKTYQVLRLTNHWEILS